MPIQIQAPDGSIVEFPDATDDATIKDVMRRNFGGPKTAPAQPTLQDFQSGASPVGPWTKYQRATPAQPTQKRSAEGGAGAAVGPWTKYQNATPALPMTRDFQSGTPRPSPSVVPGNSGTLPQRDALYVAQRADRALADTLGAPVDLATAGINIGLLGADKLSELFGGNVDFRFVKPFMGSDWIADRAESAAKAVGSQVVAPQEVSPTVRMVGEATRYGLGAATGATGLAALPARALAQSGSRLANTVGKYAAPYASSARPLVGDTIAGAGAGVGVSSYDEYAPESVKDTAGPIGPMIAALMGGLGAATGDSIVSGVKDLAVGTGRAALFGRADPASPGDAFNGRPFARSEMDQAARAVQAQASNPREAAARIAETAGDLRQFVGDGSLPTAGGLSGDVGLTLLEREARARTPKPFLERDRLVNTRAAEQLASAAPAGAIPRDFTDTADALMKERLGAAGQAVRDAQGAEIEHKAALRALAEPVASAAGQRVPASQALDSQILEGSLQPLQARKNQSFAAVDPGRTVARDATSLIDSARRIREGLGRLNDPASVLPTRTLDRIAALALEAGGSGTIMFGELNALRPELAAGLAKARAAGDFALADNIQALQRALNRETDQLAAEATDAGRRAAEAQRVYSQEFAPVWNIGPGDEATLFRRDVNSDRAARTQSPPSATAGRFLRPGQPEKAASLGRIIASIPEPSAAQAEVRRFLVADLAESGVLDAGEKILRPDALRRWRDQWGSSLETAPGFRNEVDKLLRDADLGALRSGQLAREVQAAEARLSDLEKNRGALGLVLGRDPVRAVSSIFKSGDPKRNMKAIIGELGTNRRAMNGLKASVVDYLTERVTDPTLQRTADGSRTVNFGKLENLRQQHDGTLAALFAPEEMNALQQARTMLRPQQEGLQLGAHGSLSDQKKSGQAWTLLEGGLKARYGVLKGGGILRTIRIFIARLPDQEDAVQAIVHRMFFDPDLAVHLLDRNVDLKSQLWNEKLNKLLAAATGAREAVAQEN